MKKIDFVNNYRILDLKPNQIKNFLNSNAKDFATRVEKKIFHSFNTSNYYRIEHRIFPIYELAEKFIEKNPAYKNKKIKQVFILIMNK